jgi:preprotein translocase subunit SecA
VHGTFEDVMEDKSRKIDYLAESHTPESIGDDYQEIIKYVRKLGIEYQASSADTVAEEMEYYRKNADNKTDFEKFLDNYDTEDSDSNLYATEMAILGMLDDDDNSYSPNNTATIIPIKRDGPKVGRNDPCPCGSGKKYKKCCL